MKLISDYLANWYTIIVRPIYFYTTMKEESWQQGAFTFYLITSWLLALVATIVVFIIQLIPIGSTLVEGVSGVKFLIVLPVLVTLTAVFFAIVFLILGAAITFALFFLLYSIALLLHYVCFLLGGKGSLERTLQAVFYSSAILVIEVFVFVLMILTKNGALEFTLFRVGFNLVYGFVLLYVYGLWAIIARKNYDLPKTQAFIAALAPVVLMLLFGFVFDRIGLLKLRSWIT